MGGGKRSSRPGEGHSGQVQSEKREGREHSCAVRGRLRLPTGSLGGKGILRNATPAIAGLNGQPGLFLNGKSFGDDKKKTAFRLRGQEGPPGA